MEWIEVTIITNRDAIEPISDLIHTMGAGVSIQDPMDIIRYKPEADWVEIDNSIISDNLEEVVVKAYFSTDVADNNIKLIRDHISQISEYTDVGKSEIIVNKVNDSDWENAWKQYYKPVKVGNKIVIKPSWEYYEPTDNEIIIELDPGMAFGTGTHETTRMCMKFLEEFVQSGSIVFDIGCGSGILGICASKLGAQKVIGVDLDIVAVKSSKNNILLNNIQNIEIIHGNLLDVINQKADIIVANIVADVIISISEAVNRYLSQDGIFICSGIIKERIIDVEDSLIKSGFQIIRVDTQGEWAAIAASKAR